MQQEYAMKASATTPLRVFREKRDIPLGEAARDLGISRTQLWRIETGRQDPQPDLTRRIIEWSGRKLRPNDLIVLREAAE